jgi:DNA polymerase (family 10)
VAITNSEIAQIFGDVADILEIQGANPFRVRAYRTAARTISGLGRNVADMIDEGEDLFTEAAGGTQR